MSTYEPKPIATSGVELEPELDELVEKLAASNHDHWAAQRLSQGWSHGATRDDAALTHPDLVPYDELSEVEKDYDRTSVVETLKAIIALGYDIRSRA